MKNYYTIIFGLLFFIVVFFPACINNKVHSNTKYIIEFIGTGIDVSKIKLVANARGIADTRLYQWKNHLVLYSQINKVEDFVKDIVKTFPGLKIKIYDKPVYNFSKAERCKNTDLALELKHNILTANLVSDEKLQQEYLEYHRTQFEAWPEVAQGFCNADFQQVLVYKNGRQLMLVISIPAGKTLEELDSKTVENNPRVVEWNQVMGKFQEGIQGTEPGEKWVFLLEK